MQHSTGYIIGFSAAICVVCALLVSGSAVSLKPLQERNALVDKQKNILAVAGLMGADEALSPDQVQALFSEKIRPVVVNLETGQIDQELDASSFDQRSASKDPETSQPAPTNASKILRIPYDGLVYEVVNEGEVKTLILPIEGMGLWSILYGYLALDTDLTTIRGITFYEQGETAGLGGEVENPRWKALWPGRRAFDDRGNVKIQVKKGAAGPPEDDPYQVDGLSGATLTSRGVTNMIRFWLGPDGFGPFIAQLRNNPSWTSVKGT